MTDQQQPPIFLHRASYRQRRIRDAAKLMPVVGLIMWMIPLAWPSGGSDDVGAHAVLYIFGVWVLLIVLTALLANAVRADASGSGPATQDD